MSVLIVYGKTSSHSNHIRQKVDIKYDGRRGYLLYPRITPLSLTQAFPKEKDSVHRLTMTQGQWE